MSHIADVVLLTSSGGEDYQVARINEWLADGHYHRLTKDCILSDVSGKTQGGWAMQSKVYIGAFNYLDVSGLAAFVKGLLWREAESIMLLVRDEHDERFKILVDMR